MIETWGQGGGASPNQPQAESNRESALNASSGAAVPAARRRMADTNTKERASGKS